MADTKPDVKPAACRHWPVMLERADAVNLAKLRRVA